VHFAALLTQAKRCEIRLDDRGYQVGDLLLLQKWDPDTREYVKPAQDLAREITHIARDVVGLLPGYVVLSISTLGGPNPLLVNEAAIS
jgi:hypothetical protein